MLANSTEVTLASQSAHPLAKRGLRAIVSSAGVSTVGDGVFLAAAPLAAATVTRNPAALGTVLAAEMLPWLIVAPFAGVFVDRWPRRVTMIAADVSRGVVVAVLAVLVALNMATVPAIAGCVFLIMSGLVFHSASSEAIVADLARRDEQVLHTVNGRIQSVNTVGGQLLGPPLGSWSYAIRGWIPFAADALSFMMSGLLLLFVPRVQAPSGRRQAVWDSMRQGSSYLARHRELRSLAVLTAAANLSANAGMATLVLFATDPSGLAVPESRYGLLLAAMAMGGLISGLAAPHVIRILSTRVVFVASIFLEGLAWAILLASRLSPIAALALFILGSTFTLKTVVIQGARQRMVPPELLGRVISAYRIVGNGSAPVGALFGGIMASLWGLRAPMIFAAIVLAASGLFALSTPLEGGRQGSQDS